MDTTSILVSAAAGLGGLIIGAIVCAIINKAQGKSASVAAAKIRKEAELAAETLKREANITAREDARRIKDEIESELKERRKEVSQAEKRVQQKEDNLDRKSNSLDSKLKNLERKEGELEEHRQRLIKKEDELKATIAQQIDELQRIAELDRETAKNMILEKLKGEVENECGLMVRDALDDAKRRIERESQELMVNAIQRYSGDCTYERTTATIPLPNDEMKGRIIGREGRNIRALEAATGVNILIDDTPEAVVISCFDPIRKEIARRLMEKLISDGRIHPTRIEELIKKISREIDEEVFSVGERAVLDCGLHGVPKAL
ncbi:MAG: DUF3552 domain-containing protein, partial [Lentisphaeria bacterium]|nr:DUF3552 domain-containing protein [Lentisphaeria bacterium]